MPEFLKKNWMTIALALLILVALGILARENMDAATAMLPGVGGL